MRFEENPELEFEHFLTRELGFGTVRAMRCAMTHDEFVHWYVYYARKRQQEQLARK